MKIAIDSEQYEKLEHELRSYLGVHPWGLAAALKVAVTQNSIFSFMEQWVLLDFVRCWVSQESGVADLEAPLTEQQIAHFLTNFVILNEQTHNP